MSMTAAPVPPTTRDAVSRAAEAIADKDPATLPPLDTEYPLTAEQISQYQRDGHILLRRVATPEEVAAYREVITGMTMEFAKGYKPLSERDTYGKAFIQLSNLWETSKAVARYTLARRFAEIAAELMGVDGVRLYHDQSLYKEAGGGHTPWHQDQQYWPLDGAKCLTMWMPLVDAKESMGTMRFASGSQALGYLGAMNISDDSEQQLADLVQEKGYPISYAGAMQAGDATFHNGWTIHGAPGNSSESTTREVMTVIYVEDGVLITPPDSPQRENDLRRWFPDRAPGEPAASRLNPLIYKK